MAVTGALCPLPLRLGGDATTGWTVEQHARAAADLVAIKRTAKLCVFSWSLASNGATPSISDYRGMNGTGIAFAPTVNSSSGSTMTFRWPNVRFVDSYQIAAGFVPRHGSASVASTSFARAVVELLGDGVKIRVFDAAGSALAAPLSGSVDLW
jgi:hypothetical protein